MPAHPILNLFLSKPLQDCVCPLFLCSRVGCAPNESVSPCLNIRFTKSVFRWQLVFTWSETNVKLISNVLQNAWHILVHYCTQQLLWLEKWIFCFHCLSVKYRIDRDDKHSVVRDKWVQHTLLSNYASPVTQHKHPKFDLLYSWSCIELRRHP